MSPIFPEHRAHCDAIVAAVRRACDPYELVRAKVPPRENWGVLSIGKAAPAMDAACQSWLDRRLVITTPGTDLWGDPAHAAIVDHPLPTRRNIDASERMVRWTLAVRDYARGRDDLAYLHDRFEPEHLQELLTGHDRAAIPLIVNLSGGASACLAAPLPGLSLDDLRAITAALLASSCTIDEVNTVRKHLELFKGGRLAAHLAQLGGPRDVAVPIEAFVLSDVVSGDIAMVGSGPLSPDPTTFADALDVLRRHRLHNAVPAVEAFLEAGARGEHPETLKPGDPVFARVRVTVVGSVIDAAHAASLRAQQLGFSLRQREHAVQGDAAEVGQWLGRTLRDLRRAGADMPSAIVLGGETTVRTARATGKGGRNQELALAAALELDGTDRVAVVAFASDGVDGPTDAAGAVVTGETVGRLRRAEIDPRSALVAHDSHTALDRVQALIRSGPTGTNVNDIAVGLVY